MDTVYRAVQAEPVQREVALKVITPGMDTEEVVARFDSERQSLAVMDHSNIAKVLDAGATELGRPYFVMELVRGAPIGDVASGSRCAAARRRAFLLGREGPVRAGPRARASRRCPAHADPTTGSWCRAPRSGLRVRWRGAMRRACEPAR